MNASQSVLSTYIFCCRFQILPPPLKRLTLQPLFVLNAIRAKANKPHQPTMSVPFWGKGLGGGAGYSISWLCQSSSLLGLISPPSYLCPEGPPSYLALLLTMHQTEKFLPGLAVKAPAVANLRIIFHFSTKSKKMQNLNANTHRRDA